jgi:hypothetical protein
MSQHPSVDQLSASPEIKFWKRYSPHHELSLSSVLSILLHTLLVGLLLLIGILVVRSRDSGPLETSIVAIDEGPGNGGGGGNEEVVPHRREAGQRMTPAAAEPSLPKNPDKVLAVPQPAPVHLAPDNSGERIIGDAEKAAEELAAKTRALRDRLLKQQQEQGPSTSGPPGGRAKGPPRARIERQAQRMDRWVLTFETRDGFDYLRQLEALGAILAVPLEGDRFLVIRNLKQRPARGTVENAADIQRIFWIDDKPESVRSLARALQLEQVPSHVVAFFPDQLEEDLLRKELAFRHRHEEEIRKTYFRLERHGSRFEPVVVDQTYWSHPSR